MTVHTVYVIAWEYNTGGGFDWYPYQQDRDKEWEEEMVDMAEFKNEGYVAIRLSLVVESEASEEITREVEKYLHNHPELFSKEATQ